MISGSILSLSRNRQVALAAARSPLARGNSDLQRSMTIPSWLPQGEVLALQAMWLSPQSLFGIGPPGFAVVQ
jgi:hypothetical protein